MPTWYDSSFLDLALNDIQNSCDAIWLLDDYDAADDWATVSGRKIGEATINNTNFTGPQAGAPANARELVFDGVGGNATSNSTTQDLHIAIVDTGSSTVLVVTNETSKQSITSGNPITFPAFTMDFKQPTQA